MTTVFLFSSIAACLLLFFWILRTLVNNTKQRVQREINLLSPADILIEPQPASFRGSTKKYGRVKCNGQIYLTREEIVFHRYVGNPIRILVSRIAGVSENEIFLRAARLGSRVFVITLTDETKIGFYLQDNAQWCDNLTEISPRMNTEDSHND